MRALLMSIFMPVDEETLMKVIRVIGGDDAVKIARVLMEKEEATDEEIANKTEISLNIVRKILYRLYNHSLVSLRWTRDEQTGWFTFYWKLQPTQLDGFIINQKKRILEKLEVRLKYEKSHDFYYCGTPGCRRMTFEDAVELVFKCPTCGKLLKHFDNSKIIKVLTERVNRLREELKDLGH